ncbi:MAG: hypothetical protein JW829_17215 [Pirellulales bacterium]|nr:hypothetical protein [Pirellulales bacterium]
MKTHRWFSALACLAFFGMFFSCPAAAQYAAQVVSYDAGLMPAPGGYTNPTSAIGPPERFTGEGIYPQVVSPFNPPWGTDEIVSIGEGGSIALRLSHYVLPQVGVLDIGIFVNSGLIDVSSWPDLIGQASDPAMIFFGADSANVEVSEDGVVWSSLGNMPMDIPTNGYSDLTDPYSAAAGTIPSDFQRPFTGTLGSFDGRKYFDADGTDILDVLAGSAGGTWLDLASTGLDRIGYIRFSVADDGDSDTSLNFELDAVTIAHGAAGAATVPEPPAWLLALLSCSLVRALNPTTIGPGRGI